LKSYYNHEVWDRYTQDNADHLLTNVSQYLYHISAILGARRILEAGCNVGNNLEKFPKELDVHGVDMNRNAIEKAKQKNPTFTFKNENISNTSYDDSYFDLVFTRGVFIHIPKTELENCLTELFRLSNKWILNLEYFGNDGDMIKWKRGDNLLWYRNMKELWKKFDVEIISDVELPLDIDFDKMRLTLVKKNS